MFSATARHRGGAPGASVKVRIAVEHGFDIIIIIITITVARFQGTGIKKAFVHCNILFNDSFENISPKSGRVRGNTLVMFQINRRNFMILTEVIVNTSQGFTDRVVNGAVEFFERGVQLELYVASGNTQDGTQRKYVLAVVGR